MFHLTTLEKIKETKLKFSQESVAVLKAKIINTFANNISADIKLSKTQISKIIQSGGPFGSWLGNLGQKSLRNIAIYLVRDKIPGLVRNLTSNAINKFERNISKKGAVRAGKGFTLFNSNEDMDDIIKTMKSLESQVH